MIMGLNLVNLDERTRRYMLEEVDLDVSSNNLYVSPRLSTRGQHDYENLLREAIRNYDDVWLARNLCENGRLNTTEERRKPSGGFSTVKVPVNAHEMLAEGEFNRFYARGLCLRAIADEIQELVIYRAKEVRNPRSDSEQRIGKRINAKALLDDLRSSSGVEPALGLPPGPNSGLSVKLI